LNLKKINIIFFVLILCAHGISAQSVEHDSVAIQHIFAQDSIFVSSTDAVSVPTNQIDTLKKQRVEPNRVVWMGAIVPGLGQILNEKYWKLPIVYGGFLVCAYAITWNGSRYTAYKNAYRDAYQELEYPNTTAKSYLDILPKGTTVETFHGLPNVKNIMKTRQDNFRRYRDLSVLISIAYYGITVLDAYVDAQLFDFDISPDLSMSVRPKIELGGNPTSFIREKSNYGVQLSFNF
jgi:hypothetical protein